MSLEALKDLARDPMEDKLQAVEQLFATEFADLEPKQLFVMAAMLSGRLLMEYGPASLVAKFPGDDRHDRVIRVAAAAGAAGELMRASLRMTAQTLIHKLVNPENG